MTIEQKIEKLKADYAEVEKRCVDLLEEVRKSSTAKTSIPEEEWGVHRTHCCFKHGCKYGDNDCPVVLGIIKQDYECEICTTNSHDISLDFISYKLKEVKGEK